MKSQIKKINIAIILIIMLLAPLSVSAAQKDNVYKLYINTLENIETYSEYYFYTSEELTEYKKNPFVVKGAIDNLEYTDIDDFHKRNISTLKYVLKTGKIYDQNNNQAVGKIEFHIVYKNSKDDISFANNHIKSKINNFQGKNDYELLKEAYQVVLKELNYGFVKTAKDEKEALKQERNVRLAIEGKPVVCEAYALYLKLFMDQLKIDNKIVIGVAGIDTKGGHAWNAAKIDGKWYLLDPTWSDHPDSDIQQSYFLRGHDFFKPTHIADKSFKETISKNDYKFNIITNINTIKEEIHAELFTTKRLIEKITTYKDINDEVVKKDINNTFKILKNNENVLEQLLLNIESDPLKLKNWSKTKKDINNKNKDVNNTILYIEKYIEYSSKNIIPSTIEEEMINTEIKALNNIKNKISYLDYNQIKLSLDDLYKRSSSLNKDTLLKELNEINNKISHLENKVSINEKQTYISGYKNNTFRGENFIIREEVATIISNLLGDIDIKENSFKDVNHRWSSNNIKKVSTNNIVFGYPDNSFKPTKNITRAEAVVILLRYQNASIVPVKGSSHWADDYINYATKNNIVKGYPDGLFKPNNEITRAEFVTMVNRILKRDIVENNIKGFKDIKNKWYENEVMKAISNLS